MEATIKLILIKDIIRDENLQPRTTLDQDTIDEYTVAVELGADFPPVVVWNTDEGYILSSGFHRVAAFEAAGKKKVNCEVREGTRRDATWHALGENKTHGLKRSNADKRRAVELALADKEWRKWSDRKIAEHCGVHPETVGNVRRQLSESDSSPTPPTRLGADGKERRLPSKPTANVKHAPTHDVRQFEMGHSENKTIVRSVPLVDVQEDEPEEEDEPDEEIEEEECDTDSEPYYEVTTYSGGASISTRVTRSVNKILMKHKPAMTKEDRMELQTFFSTLSEGRF